MNNKFYTAPMLDLTTNECRKLWKLFSANWVFFSEMITTGAIIYGDRKRFLSHNNDYPCILQLGGGNPEDLAQAVKLAEEFNYQGINLNAGCPSDRVQNAKIGACLMKEPYLIAKCLTKMAEQTNLEISLKHRLAIDEQDERELFNFIELIKNESPCQTFFIHARKAWLKGLNPKENRHIPPLNYPLVYELKNKYPELNIIINGGILDKNSALEHLNYLDGIMIGRAIYENPFLLTELGGGDNKETIIKNISAMIKNAVEQGEKLSNYTRHLLGLFKGELGAKKYRQILSEKAPKIGAGFEVWEEALSQLMIS